MMNTETEELETVQQVNTEVIYQSDKAAIDMQITTAKAYPRNLRRSIEEAVFMVSMDKETAATCTYSVPRGGKAITGPSVHLARILAQSWGNMRINSRVVNIDGTHVTSEAVCFDLEKNLAIQASVKRSIINSKGNRFNEDMITVTGNAASSIAMRNAILSVIPKSVVNKVYAAAKQTITGDISDKNKLMIKRKEIFDALQQTLNVTEKEILAVVGKASVDFVDADDIVVIIGVAQAIKDGDTTVELAFKGEKTKEILISLDELEALIKEKMPLLTKKELDDARRIIDNKEEASYKKLHGQLTNKK